MRTFVMSLFFANAIARTDTTPHEQTASLDAACQAKDLRAGNSQNVVNSAACVAPPARLDPLDAARICSQVCVMTPPNEPLSERDLFHLREAEGYRYASLDLRFEGGPWLKELYDLEQRGLLESHEAEPDYMLAFTLTARGREALGPGK